MLHFANTYITCLAVIFFLWSGLLFWGYGAHYSRNDNPAPMHVGMGLLGASTALMLLGRILAATGYYQDIYQPTGSPMFAVYFVLVGVLLNIVAYGAGRWHGKRW